MVDIDHTRFDTAIQDINHRLNELVVGQGEIKAEVAEMRGEMKAFDERLESEAQRNTTDHSRIVSLVESYKDDVDAEIQILRASYDDQQSTLDKRKGAHKVVWWFVGALLLLVSGAAGHYLPKLFKLLGQ